MDGFGVLSDLIRHFSRRQVAKTLAEEVSSLFTDHVQRRDDKNSTNDLHLISYMYDPPNSGNNVGFNISLDISGCGRGFSKNSIAGTYTYPNRTTQGNVTVTQILDEVKAVQHAAPHSDIAEADLRAHTLSFAQDVLAMANGILDGGIVCIRASQSTDPAPIHDELRRLLWLSDRQKDLASLFGSSAAAGVTVGLITFAIDVIATKIALDEEAIEGNNIDFDDVSLIQVLQLRDIKMLCGPNL